MDLKEEKLKCILREKFYIDLTDATAEKNTSNILPVNS